MIASWLMAIVMTMTPADSVEDLRPWRWSPYVAAGYGVPNGLRGEVGYNIADYFSLGLNLSAYDHWSRDPQDAMFGLQARVFVTELSSSFTPYVSIGAGGSMNILGPSDEFIEGMVGAMIPLDRWLFIRPELGLSHVSKVVSGGGWFGARTWSDRTRGDSRPGLPLSLMCCHSFADVVGQYQQIRSRGACHVVVRPTTSGPGSAARRMMGVVPTVAWINHS